MAVFTYLYTNATNQAIPDDGRLTQTLNVITSGTVVTADITVTLTHTWTNDLDLALFGPDANNNLVFMSDSGGNGDLLNTALTFSDSGATTLLNDNSVIATGTYRPTNHTVSAPGAGTNGNPDETAAQFGQDPALVLNNPGPTGAATFATAFGGTDTGGNWTLVATDDDAIYSGSLGNWSLQLTTSEDYTYISGSTTATNLFSVGTNSPGTGTMSLNGQLVSFSGLNSINFTGGDLTDIMSGGSEQNVFAGGSGLDYYYGNGGHDDFVVNVGDGFQSEVYDGGTGLDSLVLQGGGSYSFDLTNDGITLMDRLVFADPGGGGTGRVVINAGQIGTGLSFTATIVGEAYYGDTNEILEVRMEASTSLNLSGMTFTSFNSMRDRVEIIGDGDGETITGSSVRDIINSAGGVDVIAGGAGNDWLFGGAGADTATGGADADMFAFDGTVSNVGDVVTDYAAGDRLFFGNTAAAAVFSTVGANVFVNGVQLTNGTSGNVIAITQADAPILTDLALQALAITSGGIGGGAYILTEFDANSNETYRTRSDYRNAFGQLDSSWTYMDAGQAYHSRYTDYDLDGAGTWARIESTYITAGVLDYQWTYYDAGGAVHSMYNEVDQANSGNWKNIQTFYSAIGVIDYQWTYYDVGYSLHSAFVNYDQANANNWTTINQYYISAGVMDYQWTYYDVGQPQVSQFVDYDQANANIWSSIQTAYSALNVIDFRWTYYDVGQPKYADFIDYDQANSATWSSQAITYSALNVIDYRWTYYDAGQPQHSEFIDFDQANAGTWSSQQIAYAAPSVIDYRWTYYDVGQPLHSQFIDYDQANAYSWSQHIISYSAPGVVVADYYV